MHKPSFYSILLFLISLYSLYSKEPNIFTIPLKLVNNTYGKYPFFKGKQLIIEKEVEVQTLFGKQIRRLKEPMSGEIEVLENSALFAIPITIGFNQTFNVILDTGSVYLWVALIGSQDKHKIDKHFDPKQSNTIVSTTDPFEIKYGTGETKGFFYKDYVKFITNNAYNIKFGLAGETDFNVPGAHGIMGLAKKYTDNFYSPLWTLYSKGVFSTKSFSFKYLKDKNNVEMYIGDEHSDFENEENTAECQLLTQTTYDNMVWTCKLYTFGLISQDSSQNITAECGYNFLFDTGSNTMILPMETFDILYKNLSIFGCEKGKNDNGIVIVCPDNIDFPDAFIEVGNHYLFLDHKEMFQKIDTTHTKVFNAVFQEDITISLIGQPFFKLFHTRFDLEKGVLKFYTDNPNYMKLASEKPPNDKARSFEPIDADAYGWLNQNLMKIVAIVAIFLAVIIVLVCLCKCCKNIFRKKSKTPTGKQNEMAKL
jgi:hypothetical protein